MDWYAILPHMILAGGGFLLLCLAAFWRPRAAGLFMAISFISVFFAGAEAILIPPESPQFLGMLEVGGYGRFFTVLIAVIAGFTLLFSDHYARLRHIAVDEFYGLIPFAALGMILVAGAIHWVIFFLGLEVLSISLYILIAIRKTDLPSNEAGIKYFVMGAVSSAFLTFGIAFTYAMTGSLEIPRSLTPGIPVESTSLVFLGWVLVLVGIGFKISMVPFHLWTPDVYQGAPAPVTAFLSTGSKVALFAALLRLAAVSGSEVWAFLLPVFWVLAVVTMAAGTIAAVAQLRLKRLLAYSSVAQMGYLLMTLITVKESGAPAIIFYLAVYALMDLGAFGTVALLSAREKDLDDLDECRGLAYRHPWAAAVLAVSLISLAGLPPTGGFIGKFALFRAVLQSGHSVIAIIGILSAIISVYFYFKVVVAFFMNPVGRTPPTASPALADGLAGGLILILILGLGIFPEPLFAVIRGALPALGLP